MVGDFMIGKILKFIRTNRKYKQIDIAKKLNIGQTTLSGWERGFREPTFDMILKISEICDYEIIIKDKKSGEYITLDKIKRQ